MIVACTPPYGVFRGVNFMTPEVVAYYKLKHGYAELSRGRGIEGEDIYGVTIRTHSGGRFDPDRSTLFWSLGDAEKLVEELS